MAGLYITLSNAEERRLNAIAKRMRFSDETEEIHRGEISYIWLGHDEAKKYAPASDPATGVRCITGGRLCWPVEGWQKAERLPYFGGYANRLMLERFLKYGAPAVAPYNGAATVVIWDPRDQTVHLWTDQFGYHPAFLYRDGQKKNTVFTTFPDAVAVDLALDVAPDYVSMAEFLRAWRVTPPHTYYQNLKHAGAATYYRFDLSGDKVERNEYWQPFENGFYKNKNEAAESLASALLNSIKERTRAANKSVFFVSGGADSRVMLYAADDPNDVWGINIYEKPTYESHVAKQLCDRAGVTYVGYGRDNDYYPRMQENNVRWSGAMWSIEDNHYLGVHDVVEKIGPDLVMSACTTDWLFKGYGLEKTYRRFLGRNLPIKRFLSERVDGFLPNYPLNPPAEFEDEINSRIGDWFDGTPSKLYDDIDFLKVEDRRVRPACYTVSVSGQIMYRTYPYDTFLADSRVADCYAMTPAKWKLNGEVWGMAAGKVCSGATDIVDANYGWAVNAGLASRLISFGGGWLKRRIVQDKPVDNFESHPPCSASWPDYGWYATHSKRVNEFWNHTTEEDRQFMKRLWGEDPWSEPLESWANRPNDLMRILTILQHWSTNDPG